MTTADAEPTARWEFRAWGAMADQQRRLGELGRESGHESAADLYLIGQRVEVNAKIRGDALDVKRLVDQRDRFQRWQPDWAHDAPFPPSVVSRLVDELGGSLSLPPDAGHLTADELAETVMGHHGLFAVKVAKRRRFYDLDGVRAEVTDMTIGKGLWSTRTVTIESSDLQELIELRSSLDLDDAINLSMNMALLPLFDPTGADAI